MLPPGSLVCSMLGAGSMSQQLASTSSANRVYGLQAQTLVIFWRVISAWTCNVNLELTFVTPKPPTGPQGLHLYREYRQRKIQSEYEQEDRHSCFRQSFMRLKKVATVRLLNPGDICTRGLSNVTLDANQGDVEDVLNRNTVSCYPACVHAM